MPDLQLTGDQFVDKLSTVGQPTRPTQPSISLCRYMSSNRCNYMDYGGGDHQTADQAACGCLVTGQSPWVQAWAAQPIDCTSAVFVTQKHCCCSRRHVVLYKCYMPFAFASV